MSRHAPRAQKSQRSRGFTLVEVMMGVALSAIGIIGISFMQTTSVRSNQDAYESMVASNFARTWIERVRRDAMYWNTPGMTSSAIFPGRAGGTNYFVANGTWTAPAPLLAAGIAQESSGANYHGVEVGLDDPTTPVVTPVLTSDIYYCTHLRFTALEFDAQGRDLAMAVDARVYWARKGSLDATQYDSLMVARQDPAGCSAAAATYTDAQVAAAVNCQLSGAANYCMRVHYLRTVIRMVPSP